MWPPHARSLRRRSRASFEVLVSRGVSRRVCRRHHATIAAPNHLGEMPSMACRRSLQVSVPESAQVRRELSTNGELGAQASADKRTLQPSDTVWNGVSRRAAQSHWAGTTPASRGTPRSPHSGLRWSVGRRDIGADPEPGDAVRRIGSDRPPSTGPLANAPGFQRPTPYSAALVTDSQRRHAFPADASASVGRGNPCAFESYEPGAVNWAAR
jgi:hypothetical protein